MKIIAIMTFCVLLGRAQLGVAGPSAAASEASVRALVARETAAWNRGDARGYSEAFEQNGWFTNVLGLTYSGRNAFEQRHAKIFATFFRGSHLRQTVQRIRVLRPNVAMVEVDTEVTGYRSLPPGVRAGADGVLRTRLLEILDRENGKWRMVAYHNVDVKPAATSR